MDALMPRSPYIERRARGYMVRWEDSLGKLHSRYGGRRKAEATRIRAQIKRELSRYAHEQGLFRTAPATISGLRKLLVNNIWPTVTEPTRRNYTRAITELEKHSGQRLCDVTPMVIAGMVADLKRAGRAASTINLILRHLKAAFQRAEVWDMIARNPFRGIKPLVETSRKPRILSDHDEVRLWAAAYRPVDQGIVALALSGLRAKEIAHFNIHDDLDLTSGTIWIRCRDGNETKSKRERQTFLASEYRAPFKAILNRCTTYPFYRSGNAVSRRFLILARAAGVKIKLHELRATFSTRLVQKGVSPLIIQQVMGHKDLKVTSEKYLNPDIQTALSSASNPHKLIPPSTPVTAPTTPTKPSETHANV
jgi:integrase